MFDGIMSWANDTKNAMIIASLIAIIKTMGLGAFIKYALNFKMKNWPTDLIHMPWINDTMRPFVAYIIGIVVAFGYTAVTKDIWNDAIMQTVLTTVANAVQIGIGTIAVNDAHYNLTKLPTPPAPTVVK